MIPEVDAVAINIEDNVLTAHIAIGLATLVIDAIKLHCRPPRNAHLAQSSDHSTSSSSGSGSSSTPQGVILTPSEYEEYLHLTQATKSSSIAPVA